MDTEKILLGLDDEDLEKLAEAIKFKRVAIAEEKIQKIIEEHKQYIGKCYKKKIGIGFKYIKLISAESENEYWMEALTFQNPVSYCFYPSYHKYYSLGDKYYGEILYDGINVESIGWFTMNCNDDYIEITLEEFNKALDEHVKELKKMNWGK